MGNRLALNGGVGGGSSGGGGGHSDFTDSSADSALHAADCVSTLSLVHHRGSGDGSGGGIGDELEVDSGLSNLGFAQSLKDVNMVVAAAADAAIEDAAAEADDISDETIPPPLPLPRGSRSSSVASGSASPPTSRPRICPILQNGRQVTKDFYWVLPERRVRLNRQRSFQEASLSAASGAVVRRGDNGRRGDCGEDVYQNLPATTTITAPRRACRSESGSASPGSSSVRQLAARVRRDVPGVTEDECRLALSLHSLDPGRAARYLLVEQLFRLGLAERPVCLAELEATGWRLEAAGARLVDRAAGWGE